MTTSAMQSRMPDIEQLRRSGTRNALLIGLIVLVAYYAANVSVFLDLGNLRNIFVQAAIPIVVAVPIGLLLMAGQVDLSVGSTMAVCAVVAGLGMTSWGLPAPFALSAAVLVGVLIGAINGLLVATFSFSSLIVTLGGLAALRGAAQVLSPNAVYGFPDALVSFGNGDVLGVPYLVICALVTVILGWAVLELSRWGKHIRAVGVSSEAAYLSGVRTRGIVFSLYVAAGLAASIAAIMSAARLNSAPSTSTGLNLELDVLTAALLGGVALGGGRGSIRGLVLGVLFLTTLQNGLTLMDVPPAWAIAAKGIALIVAAFLDWITRRET